MNRIATKKKAIQEHNYSRMSEWAWESIEGYIRKIAEELAKENEIKEDTDEYNEIYDIAIELLLEDMTGRKIWEDEEA